MSYNIATLSSPDEFSALWKVQLVCLTTPWNPLAKYSNRLSLNFSPSTPSDMQTIAAAAEANKLRQVAAWEANPNLHWLQAIDEEIGEVVGGMMWTVNEKGYSDEQLTQVELIKTVWYEDEEMRRFAERVMKGMRTWQVERLVGKPHMELAAIFVHPSHRLHGVARQLTNWGLAKADEKRLDTYVTALPFAVPFYHKCGFVVVEEFNVNLGVDAEEPASEQWKRWATDDLRVIMMVRRCGEEAAVKED